jgi:hypothetical protein
MHGSRRFTSLMFQPSVLTGFRVQSDKNVSRETFWYD